MLWQVKFHEIIILDKFLQMHYFTGGIFFTGTALCYVTENTRRCLILSSLDGTIIA